MLHKKWTRLHCLAFSLYLQFLLWFAFYSVCKYIIAKTKTICITGDKADRDTLRNHLPAWSDPLMFQD
jgi:hypothetical protein